MTRAPKSGAFLLDTPPNALSNPFMISFTCMGCPGFAPELWCRLLFRMHRQWARARKSLFVERRQTAFEGIWSAVRKISKTNMKAWLVGILVSLFLCSCKSPEKNRDNGLSYRSEEMIGAWFGFAQADVYLYRVRFGRNGFGDGSYSSHMSETPKAFKISNWRLDGINTLSVQIAAGSEISKVEGHLSTRSSFFGVLYGSSGWSNSVVFYKEAPFEKRLKALR